MHVLERHLAALGAARSSGPRSSAGRYETSRSWSGAADVPAEIPEQMAGPRVGGGDRAVGVEDDLCDRLGVERGVAQAICLQARALPWYRAPLGRRAGAVAAMGFAVTRNSRRFRSIGLEHRRDG